MSLQAQIVMVLWIPIVLILLISCQTRTAIITSYIGGMLFLPKLAGFNVPGLAEYTQDKATSYILILGIVFFSGTGLISLKSLSGYSPKWIDLPMLIACLSPAFSSLSNGFGLHDAIKQASALTFLWGVPYFLARIYINQWSGLRELSISMIKGGLLYIPLCLYEVRMSPRLHMLIYGYDPHSSGLSQARRLGGWRPIVFMEHGLVVAMWMVSVTVLAIWLSKAKTFNQIWQIPRVWIVTSLVITFSLLRSTGAYGYFLYAVLIIFIARYFKNNLPVWLLIFAIIFYLSGRITGVISMESVRPISSAIFSGDRSDSLLFRVRNEDEMGAKAMEQPIFGWGGWGRGQILVENYEGEQESTSVIDSNWIYMLSNYGLLGLISQYTALLLPIVLFIWRNPTKTWFDSKIAFGAALSVVLLLFVLDTMFNSSVIAIFPLICGSLSSIVIQDRTISKVPKQLSKRPLIMTIK